MEGQTVDEFCKWIDEYKKEVSWDALFDNHSRLDSAENIQHKKIKFHDLPLEMQQGIILRYCQEKIFGAEHVEEQAKEFLMMFVGFLSGDKEEGIKCRVCGCTDNDCRQCIEKTGQPCHWVEEDLCSACVPVKQKSSLYLPGRDF
jgi:hypothetical protein